MKKLMLTDKELASLIDGLWNINALNLCKSDIKNLLKIRKKLYELRDEQK